MCSGALFFFFCTRANEVLGNVFLKKKRKQRINIARCVFVEWFVVFVCVCVLCIELLWKKASGAGPSGARQYRCDLFMMVK